MHRKVHSCIPIGIHWTKRGSKAQYECETEWGTKLKANAKIQNDFFRTENQEKGGKMSASQRKKK